MPPLAVTLAALATLACAAAVSMQGLHVQGNALVNGDGIGVLIHGVDHSGTEFACAQGYGIFNGPSDSSLFTGMQTWGINAVRIPLNSICWLGINGILPQFGGAAYQAAIKGLVDEATAAGFAVILDLHWNAPGAQNAVEQLPGPDLDHAPLFWTQVATAYMSYSNVIFDLYNEPYEDNNAVNSTAAWKCWRDGCQYTGTGNSGLQNYNYTIVGFASLVATVRATGATNVIALGGINYSNGLYQWLDYAPTDPTGNLIASWHSYDGNYCDNQNCWVRRRDGLPTHASRQDSAIAPVLSRVPILTTELGENDCASGFITTLMPWLDARNASYLAWTWNNWDCNSGPSLITAYSGAPTNYGAGYLAHIRQLPDQFTPPANAVRDS